jgi:hypothetical protein
VAVEYKDLLNSLDRRQDSVHDLWPASFRKVWNTFNDFFGHQFAFLFQGTIIQPEAAVKISRTKNLRLYMGQNAKCVWKKFCIVSLEHSLHGSIFIDASPPVSRFLARTQPPGWHKACRRNPQAPDTD